MRKRNEENVGGALRTKHIVHTVINNHSSRDELLNSDFRRLRKLLTATDEQCAEKIVNKKVSEYKEALNTKE